MDANSNRPVLEVRGLTKRFSGLTAVKNLSLDWPNRSERFR